MPSFFSASRRPSSVISHGFDSGWDFFSLVSIFMETLPRSRRTISLLHMLGRMQPKFRREALRNYRILRNVNCETDRGISSRDAMGKPDIQLPPRILETETAALE